MTNYSKEELFDLINNNPSEFDEYRKSQGELDLSELDFSNLVLENIDFSEADLEMDHLDSPTPGPSNDTDTGVSSMFVGAINDEWATIDKYNSIIATLRNTPGVDVDKFIPVIEEILAEENRHIGQLQEMLKLISPNVTEISKGEKEAKSQMEFVDGKLKVQAWAPPVPSATGEPSPAMNEVSDICSLLDVDDDM